MRLRHGLVVAVVTLLSATHGISSAQMGPGPDWVAVPVVDIPASQAPNFVTFQPVMRWQNGSLQWFYNPTGAPAWASSLSVVDVLKAALAKWSSVCNFAPLYGGTTTAPPNIGDNQNVIGWASLSGYSAYTYYRYASSGTTHTLIEADIQLNPASIADAASLDAVATHEAGHMLGLAHSDVSAATMAGPPLTAYNSLQDQSTLDADDISGCQFLYGGSVPPPPQVPSCSLSTPNVTPAIGSTITLTATCTNSPTSHAWTNCTSTGATCSTTQTTPGARTYAVAGANAGGTGAPASLTVNWQTPLPSCTVASSAGTAPIAGTEVTLKATCSNAPTSYAWTGCTAMGNGSTCLATESTAGLRQYTVTPANASGAGPTTTFALSWTAAAPPVCSLTSSAGGNASAIGATVTLVANCSGAPTAYNWSGCSAPGGPTSNVCTATSTTPGTVSYSVTAANVNGTSAPATVAINWQDASGAAPVCSLSSSNLRPVLGSYVLLTASCSGGPTSYAWSNCASTSASCTPNASSPGAVTYSVTGSNGHGTGAAAQVTLDWQQVGAAPACTLSADPANPVVGSTVTLTAACSGSPTSYVWVNCSSSTSQCKTAASGPGSQGYTVTASNAFGAGIAALTLTWSSTPTLAKTTAVEFYHQQFDHFFVTANADEISKLDSGYFGGWQRTGLSFKVVAAGGGSSATATTPVCRFYGDPAAGLDSHFYSASPFECGQVKAKFPQWIWESDEVFRAFAANPDTGGCPANTQPLYRTWNARADSNHRYTTNTGVQQVMVAKGHVPEGYGDPPVAMCVPM